MLLTRIVFMSEMTEFKNLGAVHGTESFGVHCPCTNPALSPCERHVFFFLISKFIIVKTLFDSIVWKNIVFTISLRCNCVIAIFFFYIYIHITQIDRSDANLWLPAPPPSPVRRLSKSLDDGNFYDTVHSSNNYNWIARDSSEKISGRTCRNDDYPVTKVSIRAKKTFTVLVRVCY